MLEDTETGDIVCPLVYLREVFGLNYSRKTSNDRTRVIHEVPDGLVRAPTMTAQNLIQQQLMRARQQQVTGRPAQPPAEPVPCWKLPFESSTDVKLQIRELLGDEGFSKGHVRLVSLPLAFNVLSEKDEFRDTALFRAVHHVLKNTSYKCLLRRRRPAPTPDLDENGASGGREGASGVAAAVSNGAATTTTTGDDFVLVDCVPPHRAGVTVAVEPAKLPRDQGSGVSLSARNRSGGDECAASDRRAALRGPWDMQKSFDKYVDYVAPDCMAKSGGRSGSSRGTAGDNGEGLRGNSFTGPSRSLEPSAAGMILGLGERVMGHNGGPNEAMRMVIDPNDGRFSKMRRVSNTSTPPGGSEGGWIGSDGQIVDPREIVSRQGEEIHRLKQSNEWLQHELASVKNALNELIGAMTEKERMDVQRRRKALAGGSSNGGVQEPNSSALDASRSTGTDLPVDANGFYAGNNSMAASMLGTIESVQAAVVAASVGAPAGHLDAHHGLHAKPPPGLLQPGWGTFGSMPGPMSVPMRTGSGDHFLHGTSDTLGDMNLEGGADGYMHH